MEWKEYEASYNEIPQELIVLVKASNDCVISSCEKNWQEASVFLLGYVDVTTNELVKDRGQLIWLAIDEEEMFHRFKGETIYRVKARRWEGNGPEAEDLFDCHSEDEFYVTEIISVGEHEPRLEALLTDYRKPVVIEDDILGQLKLNKQHSCFEGQLIQEGKTIKMTLEVDDANKASWTKAKNAMNKMCLALTTWDIEMKQFAASKLIKSALAWQDEDKGLISEDTFASRITLEQITMNSGGSFMAYYEDDDLFAGHIIIVTGTMKKGIKSAEMAG